MARRGRPSLGPEFVDRLDGSRSAKRRLRAVLQVMRGDRTVGQACASLGIGPSRFHQLRQTLLQAGLEALEPRPPGRPSQRDGPEAIECRQLREEVAALKADLRAAQVREELALLMPHVVRQPEPTRPGRGKKGRRRFRVACESSSV
jgi:transposase-like protein